MVKLAELRLASLPIAEYLIERSELERQRFAFTTLVKPNRRFPPLRSCVRSKPLLRSNS
jgi:hypothetical protein